MILDIEIENIKSFKNQTIFSMEVENKEDERNSFIVEINKEKRIDVLKTSVLFGANASGKSNFIIILKMFRYYLLVSGKNKFREEAFRFGLEDKKSLIRIRNIINNKIYEYAIELNFKEKKILKEEMYIEKDRKSLIFTREKNKIVNYEKKVFSKYKKTIEFLNETLKDSDSILSRIKEWKMPKEIKEYINYLEKSIITDKNYDIGKFLYKNEEYKDKVLKFLDKFGISIGDIIVKREKNVFTFDRLEKSEAFQKLDDNKKEMVLSEIDPYKYSPIFIYKKSNKTYELSYLEQSEGTRKLLSLFIPIYCLLNQGGVMIIDEIDKTLHYKLVKEIIKTFNSLENKKNAQIIFSSHNLLLLDFNLFKKEQIWFLENNDIFNGTEFYSLSDIENYKENDYLLRDYLNGNFGGIPNLKEFGENIWLDEKKGKTTKIKK